ncbi:MAG: PDZ domain-containing protein [Gemmataceae bacterium]|nr:PDZ domain-containing protein [Gemmataceae bacterium]
MLRLILSAALVLPVAVPAAAQNPREKKVRDDQVNVEADGYWVYNDLPKALAEAKKAGKPVVVVLRCIPCEECVKLDDAVVDTDPVLRPLLDQYVRVRVVSTNGLDLSTFQFDTDQSFAVFLLNADGTVYGRFGTRSHRTNWVGDVSVEGLAKALEAGLELHRGYPANQAALAGKRGPAPRFPTPEAFPSLKGKYGPALATSGNVVPTCIHCHQIGDAARDLRRAKGEPMPEELLTPYPHPKSLGLVLDPKEKAAVREVKAGSPAGAAGFRAGDAIRTLDGQPIISIADVQWVLHRAAPGGATIKVGLVREGKLQDLTWRLPAGWRERDDPSWRVSAWGYRRMVTGGLLLVPADDRPAGGMALRVEHVGEYGPHAAAKKAGFRKNDVIVSFDGRTDLPREADVFRHALTARKPGETVPVKVVRDGKTLDLKLPMQE